MGIGWKKQNRCYHPEHEFQRGKKAPKVRSVPLKSLAIYNTNNHSLACWSSICIDHLKALNKSINEAEEPETKSTPVNCDTPVDDDNYIPDQAIIPNDSLDESAHAASSLCETLVTSPFSFKIKEKRIAYLSDGTKQKV